MGYPAREPLDVKMFFYHRGTWVISKLGFRNYLQWSYPKQYIRVDHVELTITSNKKSLCKQCLFLKSNLKSVSSWLTLQRFLKSLLITLHLLLAPNKRQLSFFLYFSFLHAHISSRSCTVVSLHYCSYSSAPELKLFCRYFLFPDSLEHYWY